jgi:addiction module HigA family antidote
MARYEIEFAPDYAVPPGETLAETMEHLGMSRSDLAQRSGLSGPQIDALLSGEGALTRPLAARLEVALGVPARIWLGLERNYREALARLSAQDPAVAPTEKLRKTA